MNAVVPTEKTWGAAAFGVVAAAWMSGSPAMAATDTAVLEEIVITATKRETNLQTTAAAVTAIGADDMREAQLNNLQDLPKLTPGLVVAGNGSQENTISMRGIASSRQGPGGDSPVAIYVDGVYIGQPLATMFSFPDVERIEVLRGPQGTLYGRNTTAGAVNIITRKPNNELSGGAVVSAGSYGSFDANARLNLPLNDTLYFKVGGAYHDTDGWQHYADTGAHTNDEGSRVADIGLRWAPNDKLDVDLRADYSKTYYPHKLRIFSSADPALPGSFRFLNTKYGFTQCPIECNLIYSDRKDTYNFAESYGASLTAHASLSWFDLKSITAWRDFHQEYRLDVDVTEFGLGLNQQTLDADQFSQEFNFSSNGEGPLKWLAGLYYFKQTANNRNINRSWNNTRAALLIQAAGSGHIPTESYAAFANASWDITDRLTAGIGVRQSWESKEFTRQRPLDPANAASYSFPTGYDGGYDYYNLKRSFQSFSPRGDVQFKFNDDIFGYVSVSSGAKSGGFNFGAAGPAQVPDPSFGPEKIIAYEAGLKNTLFERQLRLNVAAYHYDYTGLQVTFQSQPGNLSIFNAAEADINGAEVEFDWRPALLKGLSVSGSAAYLDAKYSDFVIKGAALSVATASSQCLGAARYNAATNDCVLTDNVLPFAPEWTYAAVVQYDWSLGNAGTLTPRIAAYHRDAVFANPFNRNDVASGSYTDLDASLTYEFTACKCELSVWGRNLTDEQHVANAAALTIPAAGAYPGGLPFTTPVAGFSEGYVSPPRVIGAQFSVEF